MAGIGVETCKSSPDLLTHDDVDDERDDENLTLK
jgi:hypothetical protein